MVAAFNQRPTLPQNFLAISVQELKDLYLFGVDLTNDDGDPYPESMFEHYIRSAQDWFQTQIPGLLLLETEIKNERHDYYMNDYMAYNFIKLFWSHVNDVSEVSIQFPLATQVLRFDPSWYRVEAVGSQVQLVPTQGTFSSILLSQGGNFLPLFYQGISNVPYIFSVTYKAGFQRGKIPPNIKNVLGMYAAIGPLNIAGDLIAGAGIASKSLSLDGLSQSISTTASATNAGYGSRIIQYRKDIEEAMKSMKEYYLGINMQVI